MQESVAQRGARVRYNAPPSPLGASHLEDEENILLAVKNETRHPLLSVEGLSVHFGAGLVVDTLDFTLDAGKTLAIVGESGSGKSVSALSILGLTPAVGGTVAQGAIHFQRNSGVCNILTLPEAQLRALRGNDIAMIFQEPMTSLNPLFTIADQIGEVLTLHQGLSQREALEQTVALLQKVRLPDARTIAGSYPHQLSGGMRQRVMIAMALACRPSLLIADEPTTALDVTVQAQILALIRDLQQETGMGLLFITHDMGVVAEMADDVVVMLRGKKVEEGNVRDIFAAPRHVYTQKLLAAVPRLGSMRGKSAPEPLPLPGEDVALDDAACSSAAPGTGDPAGTPEGGTPTQALLEVKDLSVRFDIKGGLWGRTVGRVHAVEKVNLAIYPGETLALVGESGSGKSTIGRTIQQLQAATGGDIWFRGQACKAMSARARHQFLRHVQYVFQDPFAALDPRKTIGFSIAEPIRTHGVLREQAAIEARVEALLTRVGLSPEVKTRYPHQFSGGQRQRVCIARALALKPQLIIADEALSALDVSVQAQIVNLLMGLQREENLSFLFISHDMAVVERMSHRVAVLYHGQIVELGARAQIFENPQHPYTRRLLAAVPVADPSQAKKNTRLEALEPASRMRSKNHAPAPLIYREIAPGHWVGEVAPSI